MELVYWIFAVPFSVLFLIQLIMALTGLSGDQTDLDDFEGSSDDGIDPGLKLFSIRNTIIFFTVFGWAGIAGIKADMNMASTIFISVGLGFLIMYFYALLFKHLMKLTETGTMNLRNAIGKTGKVYLKIPGERSGSGKISIEIQGAMRELDAMTKREELPTGSDIKVVDVLDNNILLVKKCNNSK